METKEVKFKFENYVGFDDDGFVETMVFLGKEDDPLLSHKFSLKEMVKDFIDVRSTKNGFEEAYKKQAELVVKSLEQAAEMLKKAV